MPEPVDVYMPILQKIQSDAAEFRDETRKSFVDVTARLERVERRVDSMDGLLTYTMGMITRGRSDADRQRAEMDAIRKRVDVIEAGMPSH